MSAISLTVDVGAGNLSDALEECYQLGLRIQIPVHFAANDSKFQVFPHWDSAMQFKPGGLMIAWKREGPRNWTQKIKPPSAEQTGREEQP